jgi:uroporphyrinogen decarboxylase
MQEAGGDVIGVDWRIRLDQAAQMLSATPLQGNLDPALLLTSTETIQNHAKGIVQQGQALVGHIFNLGHGIFPDTPLDNVSALIRAVRGEE